MRRRTFTSLIIVERPQMFFFLSSLTKSDIPAALSSRSSLLLHPAELTHELLFALVSSIEAIGTPWAVVRANGNPGESMGFCQKRRSREKSENIARQNASIGNWLFLFLSFFLSFMNGKILLVRFGVALFVPASPTSSLGGAATDLPRELFNDAMDCRPKVFL